MGTVFTILGVLYAEMAKNFSELSLLYCIQIEFPCVRIASEKLFGTELAVCITCPKIEIPCGHCFTLLALPVEDKLLNPN